jgi:Putative zinc-binding metallo-peptidase
MGKSWEQAVQIRSRVIFLVAAGITIIFLGMRFAATEFRSRPRRVETPIGVGAVTRDPLAPSIEQKYGVKLVLGDYTYPVVTSSGLIRATNAQKVEVDRYHETLSLEFLLYPREFVRRSRLKRIVLCSDLSFEGQKRSAVPDLSNNTLYLDVIAGNFNLDYQRRAIHHDFFHMIDYQDDGLLYTDEQWAKLNSPGFHYGTGGARMLGDASSGVQWSSPGFLNKYSTSGVEEDKAELFAHMMTDCAAVVKRAETDKVLHTKMAAMKALLAKFSPDLNDDFWSELCRKQSEAH